MRGKECSELFVGRRRLDHHRGHQNATSRIPLKTTDMLMNFYQCSQDLFGFPQIQIIFFSSESNLTSKTESKGHILAAITCSFRSSTRPSTDANQ